MVSEKWKRAEKRQKRLLGTVRLLGTGPEGPFKSTGSMIDPFQEELSTGFPWREIPLN